jgi:integrase
LNAVVFLFKSVVKKDIGDFSDFQRARRGFRLPVVASRDEIKAVIDRLSGRERFMAALLYGTGMRINELLRLRVQDVQFDQNRLMVRAGKGDKDRYVPFPTKYREEIKQWLGLRQKQYEADKAESGSTVIRRWYCMPCCFPGWSGTTPPCAAKQGRRFGPSGLARLFWWDSAKSSTPLAVGLATGRT